MLSLTWHREGHKPEDRWSHAALVRVARTCGLDPYVHVEYEGDLTLTSKPPTPPPLDLPPGLDAEAPVLC